MPAMKYGKKPARINSVQLKLCDYFDHKIVLPKIPAEFGHDRLVTAYGMLGNDRVGDCVFAGAAHETMLWNREAGRTIAFSDDSVLSDYSAVTGFDPSQTDPVTGENPTDGGTDVQVAASYRRRIGVVDSAGVRHKIGGYVALTPGDPDQLAAAAYIFGAVGIGIRVPDYAQDEFEAGQPWDTRLGVPNIEGGHYIPIVGRRNGMFDVVTWGRIQQMTVAFYRRFCDEAIVYLSTEFLSATGASPEGFNLAQLTADLQAFTRR
jgi:hypothetical protein